MGAALWRLSIGYKRHEASPPKISASGGGCCRTTARIAHRKSRNPSNATDYGDCPLCRRPGRMNPKLGSDVGLDRFEPRQQPDRRRAAALPRRRALAAALGGRGGGVPNGGGILCGNWLFAGVSSTGRRNTPHWSAPTVGAGAISPLRAKTLDTALVPSSGSGVIRQYWQLFQPSQRFAFSCGVNRVRACPSICMPFQRGGLE